ncbi:hypothetical protein FHS72_001859 [Loktanella ponticola]|uniref:Uncharacterized protein n=1 Tax=Yoonia ponticola TaxID=1524255 RepID=A0A7W9BKP9_9RHOB|nr:hypothetical protein [Yoonia ponticola]
MNAIISNPNDHIVTAVHVPRMTDMLLTSDGAI